VRAPEDEDAAGRVVARIDVDRHPGEVIVVALGCDRQARLGQHMAYLRREPLPFVEHCGRHEREHAGTPPASRAAAATQPCPDQPIRH
jgi:hypothetical protein